MRITKIFIILETTRILLKLEILLTNMVENAGDLFGWYSNDS